MPLTRNHRMKRQILCVGAVQMTSESGALEANLGCATRFVENTAPKGARLVAFPELFCGGDWLYERIWDTAEPRASRTEAWLRETVRRLAFSLGKAICWLSAKTSSMFPRRQRQAEKLPGANFCGQLAPSRQISRESNILSGR